MMMMSPPDLQCTAMAIRLEMVPDDKKYGRFLALQCGAHVTQSIDAWVLATLFVANLRRGHGSVHTIVGRAGSRCCAWMNSAASAVQCSAWWGS